MTEQHHADRVFLWAVVLFGLLVYAAHKGLFRGSGKNPPPTKVAPGVPVDLWTLLWHVLVPAAIIAGVIALLILGFFALSRILYRVRRARTIRLHEIVLGPDDTTMPAEIMNALEAIHGKLSTPFGTAAVGSVSMSFEIIRLADGTIHFVLGAPFAHITGVEDMLRNVYTNIRFQPWRDPVRERFPVCQTLGLTKPWWYPTQTQTTYQSSVIESLVTALDRAGGPLHLQYILTPANSGTLLGTLRHRLMQVEYSAKSQQQADPANPGLGYSQSSALKESLQLYGKEAFTCDFRIAAHNYDDAQRIYGALQQANGENRFSRGFVYVLRPVFLGLLYARMPAYLPWWRTILFTLPLATIIHLPTNRIRVNTLNRYYVRRGPAPLSILRATEPQHAMVIDHETRDYLAIKEWDREGNIAVLGGHGSGKTTDELSVFRMDANFQNKYGRKKVVVLIDIGKDTSKRALGLVSPDREVFYFNAADPDCPWTINPFLASVTDSVLSDNIITSLKQVFGGDAIGPRSEEFLTNAIIAAKEVLGDRADLSCVYRMLSDAAYREQITGSVQSPHQVAYWRDVFAALAETDERFLQQAVAAPRNKLDAVLRNDLLGKAFLASQGRTFLDMREVLRREAILIVNLDKSKLGDEGARLLGIFLISQLWYALEAQNEIEERDRVKVSLILDEGQNYVSAGFLSMLAEGRAYGLQTTIALRFLNEIRDTALVEGIKTLCQNIVVHQFQNIDEAEYLMKRFMRVFANMVQVQAESQDAVNFGVDDIIRLPKFTSICQWQVDGSMQQPFYAETINWEPYFRDDWRQSHLAKQADLATQIRAVAVEVIAPEDPDEDPVFTLEFPEEAQVMGKVIDFPKGPVSIRPEPRGLDSLSVLFGPDAAQQLRRASVDDITGLHKGTVFVHALETATREFGGGGHILVAELQDDDDDSLKATADLLRTVCDQRLLAYLDEGRFAAILGAREAQGLLERVETGLEGVKGSQVHLVSLEPGESFEAAYDRALALLDPDDGAGEETQGDDTDSEQEVDAKAPAQALTQPMTPAHDDSPESPARGSAEGLEVPTPAPKSPSPVVTSPPEPSRPKAAPSGTARKAIDPRAARIALTLSNQWTETDPRRVFCQRYNVRPARLIQEAATLGATDDDLVQATGWALRKAIAPEKGAHSVRVVLQRRVNERVLVGVATRLDLDLLKLRELLEKEGVDELAVVAAAQSVKTVDDVLRLKAR